MGITVSSPISIDKFSHFQHAETHWLGAALSADDQIPLLVSPERDIWIDAIQVRVTSGGTTNACVFYKVANGTAMAAGGTNSTALTGTVDVDALTAHTWTDVTLLTTGTTLKLAAGEMLWVDILFTTGNITDMTVYIRYHSDVTG